MDLAYLRTHVPVMNDLLLYITAAGWALLLGNLVFQSVKSMMSGLGFEGEDPKTLFARTFVFSFLLLASQQICEIALGITTTIIDYLEIPDAVNITFPDESSFGGLSAAWIVVVIVGVIIMFKTFRLIFEIAERYVIVGVLTLMSPLAFSMGGSKNTSDIFTGWCRMYGSMCLVMITNVVFLKMLLSVLSSVPSGISVLPWMVLVMSIVKVAQKVDGIITRIGLNPAITGGPARSLPGMLTYAVIRTIVTTAAKSVSSTKGSGGSARAGGSGSPPPGGNPRAGGSRPSGGPAGRTAGRPSVAGGSAGIAGNAHAYSQQTQHTAQTVQSGQAGQSGAAPETGAKDSRESVGHGVGRPDLWGGARPSRRTSVDRRQGMPGSSRSSASGMRSTPGQPGQAGQSSQTAGGQSAHIVSQTVHSLGAATGGSTAQGQDARPGESIKASRRTSVPAGMAGKGAPGGMAASRKTKQEAVYTGDAHQSVAASQSTYIHQSTPGSIQAAGQMTTGESRPTAPLSGPASGSGRPAVVSGGSHGRVTSAGAAEKPTRRSVVRPHDPRISTPPAASTMAGTAGKTASPTGEKPAVIGAKASPVQQEIRRPAPSTRSDQRQPPAAGTAGSAASPSIKRKDASQFKPTASQTPQHGKLSQRKMQPGQPQRHTRRPGGDISNGRK